MWLEPFLLISSFFVLFGISIVALRIQLRISDEQQFSNPKTAKVLETISNVFNERKPLHEKLDNQIQSYLSSSNSEQWKAAKKQAKLDFENLSKKANSCLSEIPEEDSVSITSKLQSLERLQSQRFVIQESLHDLLVEFKVENQITKAKFESKNAQLQASYEETSNDIDEELEKLLGAN